MYSDASAWRHAHQLSAATTHSSTRPYAPRNRSRRAIVPVIALDVYVGSSRIPSLRAKSLVVSTASG